MKSISAPNTQHPAPDTSSAAPLAPSTVFFDKVLIGGEWVAAADGTYPVINPATE